MKPGLYHRYKGRIFKKPLTVREGQWIVFGGRDRAYLQEHGDAPPRDRDRSPAYRRWLGERGNRLVIRTVSWVQCEPTWVRRGSDR